MKEVVFAAALGILTALPGYTQDSAASKEVTAAFNALNTAQLKKDRATMERLMAEDYLYVHSNGAVANKAQEIADNMSGEINWTGSKEDDMKVRLYGEVAIVTGRQVLTGTAKNFAAGSRRFTDLWVKRNGQWISVGGQTTLAPK